MNKQTKKYFKLKKKKVKKNPLITKVGKDYERVIKALAKK